MTFLQKYEIPLSVEKTHGTFGTNGTKRQNHFVRFCYNIWERFEFRLAKVAEDVIDLLPFVEAITDTKSKP